MSFFETPADRSDKGTLVFLQGLTAKEWAKIYTFAEMRKFAAGDVLVRAGDGDDSFYIMTAGSAQVQVAEHVQCRRCPLTVIELLGQRKAGGRSLERASVVALLRVENAQVVDRFEGRRVVGSQRLLVPS